MSTATLTPSFLDQLSRIATEALTQLLGALGAQVPAGADADALNQIFEDCRNRLGGYKALAARLHCSEEQMNAFGLAMRNFKRATGPDMQSRLNETNREILVLQLLDKLEDVREANPELRYATDLPEADGRVGKSLQQVRALELVLRGLVSEAYGDQDKLIAGLRSKFGDAQVDQWLKTADAGDVLSGTMFSDLASFFVTPTEYKAHYRRLFDDTPFLTLLSQKRETLVVFLKYIQRVRNRLAHHKRITAVQIALLNLYYREIIEPVQLAYDDSASKVNPDAYLEVSHDELERYVKNMRDDIQAVRDDLDVIGANVDAIKTTVESTKTTVESTKATVEDTGREMTKLRTWLRKNMKWVLAGVAVLGVGMAGLFAVTGGTLANTEVIKGTTERMDKKLDKVKKETSDDPRKELANMGVAWDDRSMDGAIRRGDMRTVSLFLQGGMQWHAAPTFDFLEKGDSPIVDLLLQYPAQMAHESTDCMYTGTSLTKPADPKATGKDRHARPLSEQAKRFVKLACNQPRDRELTQGSYEGAVQRYKEALANYDSWIKRRRPFAECRAQMLANDAKVLKEDAMMHTMRPPTMKDYANDGDYRYMLIFLQDDWIKRKHFDPVFLQKSVDEFCTAIANSKPQTEVDDVEVGAIKQILDVIR